MALHLVKLAVGVGDLAELRALQKERRQERGFYCFYTRNMPRRQDEVLDGGSIYWVIKGHIQARQPIRGFEAIVNRDGERRCLVSYGARLVPTVLRRQRAFQGWRYLVEEDAPEDRPPGTRENALPPAMERDLRELGLL
jgi:hypothetical protein